MKFSLSRTSLVKYVDEDTTDRVGSKQVPFPVLAMITISLPLLAFVFCVLWSLIYNFTESTSTHCQVMELLPSISAAIGSFSPQKHVWKIAIAFHLPVRYLVTYLYYVEYYKKKWILIINILEVTALAGLSFVTSSINYPIHAKCFVTFILSSLGFMYMASYQLRQPDSSSCILKKKLFWVNLSGASLAVYFFLRHNWYCEPGMYTLFALSEYTVVLSNMAFHFQAYYDFAHIQIHIQFWNQKYHLIAT